MNIKKILREKLEEKQKKNNRFDYGCVMIYLDVVKEEWDKIQNIIENDDIYFEDDNEGYGRENEPHVTILYGIHKDVDDEDVEKLINDINNPKIELEKVSTFKNDKFEVLKFDVKSKDLTELNKKFKSLPHTSTYPEYHPHITICYNRPNTSEKYISKLNQIELPNFKLTKIVYSKPDKTKKEYKL